MPIFQVIKYEGDNSTFVWKHPAEDFNTHSQLIVHETQEAVFFLNGQVLDLFSPGKYTLETQNIPLLRHFINLPTGGESAFHCEVYFINKAEQMAIQWGTDSKVQYLEPNYGFPISIGAGGEMSLRVLDSKKLLVKLVGTEKMLTRERLMAYFRMFLMPRVKTYIAQTMKANKINVFEIDEHLLEFSDELKDRLAGDFADYGITLERFFVARIVKPEGDEQYEKFKELHFRQYADVAEAKIRQQVGVIEQQTESQKTIIEAQGLAQKRSIEGFTYQQERGFDVAEKIAQNEGSGNFSSAGIGLGMMAGMGSAVGNTVGAAFTKAVDSVSEGPFSGAAGSTTESSFQNSGAASKEETEQQFCENCGARLLPGSAFCDTCGHPAAGAKKVCSKCGCIFTRPGKFCPRCGSKREEG